jgi:hypothetical protein
MQSIEAAISLLVFVSLASAFLLQLAPPGQPDDSLYRIQLADDAWRVLSLRGDFQDFGEGKRETIERDMGEIGRMTGFCIFISGVEFTNCRSGGEGHEAVVSIKKTIISDGVPKIVTFSLRK